MGNTRGACRREAGGGLAAALGPGWPALAAPMAAFRERLAALQAALAAAPPGDPARLLAERLQACSA